MNFTDWYTDRMDVWRVEETEEKNVTRNVRQLVAQAVPCRVYQATSTGLAPKETAAEVQGGGRLMCALGTDLRAGDELLVRRKGREERYFAGTVRDCYEPFGGVMPGMDHLEVGLMTRKRV